MIYCRLQQIRLASDRMGDYGSGAGSADGSAGSIRSAGGAFGKREAAFEEQYFHKLVSLLIAPTRS